MERFEQRNGQQPRGGAGRSRFGAGQGFYSDGGNAVAVKPERRECRSCERQRPATSGGGAGRHGRGIDGTELIVRLGEYLPAEMDQVKEAESMGRKG